MPKRIQRKRTKGFRLPEGCVYVGRPTRWGNPFYVGCHARIGGTLGGGGSVGGAALLYLIAAEPRPGFTTLTTPADCVEYYRELLKRGFHKHLISDLRGKDLSCWCALDQPCHADVLLELANA